MADLDLSDERIDEVVREHWAWGIGSTRADSRELALAIADPLLARIAELEKEFQTRALQYLSEQGQWIEETDALRTQLAEAQKDAELLRIVVADTLTPAPSPEAAPQVQPVAWWRLSYVEEDGSKDADVQIGAAKPTSLPDNGFDWQPLFAAPPQPLNVQAVATSGEAARLREALERVLRHIPVSEAEDMWIARSALAGIDSALSGTEARQHDSTEGM